MYTQIPLSIRISISIAPRIILSYLDENPFPKFVNLLYTLFEPFPISILYDH